MRRLRAARWLMGAITKHELVLVTSHVPHRLIDVPGCYGGGLKDRLYAVGWRLYMVAVQRRGSL